MSDTTVGHTPGVGGGVVAYVREVRAELADLSGEDIEDLTGGMEADLSELAAESGGDLTGRLGSPKVYAAELRGAAGLPERGAGSVRRRPLAVVLTHARDSFTLLVEQRPWLHAVVEFLVPLRPAWWILRGYLAAWALWSILGGTRGVRPHNLLEFIMALVAIVLSVQLGQGWQKQRSALRPLLALANTVAVIVALVAWFTMDVQYVDVSSEQAGYSPPSGVLLNGEQVDNIYAYDSDGKRITGVRLFDQAGRPVGPDQGSTDANGNTVEPVRDSGGAPLVNVYPRAMAGADPWQIADPGNPTQSDGTQPTWSPPLSIVPLVPSLRVTSTKEPTTKQPTTKPVTTKPVQPKSVQPKSAPSKSVAPSPSGTKTTG